MTKTDTRISQIEEHNLDSETKQKQQMINKFNIELLKKAYIHPFDKVDKGII
jgi:hypothetical protein